MCRGARYIGYDKRVDAPWFIVLSAFVSSRIPHQCTCDFGVVGSIDPTSSAPLCESVHATRCTSLRIYLQPCASTGTYTCKHRRVTTPPAAAFGRPQDAHTGIGPRGAFARTALRSQRGPPATRATWRDQPVEEMSWVPEANFPDKETLQQDLDEDKPEEAPLR